MNAELLYEAINSPHSLEQLNRQELDRLVAAHPYFSIGQLILAKKYKQEHDEDSYQIQRATVQSFYRNPWWLYYQLELSDNAPVTVRTPYASAPKAPFETIAPRVTPLPSVTSEEALSAYPLFPPIVEREEPIPTQNQGFVPWPDLDEPIAPTLAAAPAREIEETVVSDSVEDAPAAETAMEETVGTEMPADAPAVEAPAEMAPVVQEAPAPLEIPAMPFMITPVLPVATPEAPKKEPEPTPVEQPVLPSEAPEPEPSESPETKPDEFPPIPTEAPEMPETQPSGPAEIPGAFPREGSVETPSEAPGDMPSETPEKTPAEVPVPEIQPELPGTTPIGEPERIPAAASWAPTVGQPQIAPEPEPDAPFSTTLTPRPVIFDAPPVNTGLIFEPLHTVDYFASQGIKLDVLAENGTDRLTQHMKSFTEWLKTMKRIKQTELMRDDLDAASEAEIQHLAAGANRQKEAVVTESMAQVWVFQGKYHKAIEVYNKLSLQHPEKRAYFAAKIEQLNKQ